MASDSSLLSALYIITSQSLNSDSFSSHFSWMEVKFSWCAPLMLVMIPMVGLMMSCSLAISLVRDIPASKMPNVFSSRSIHTDNGTPICEL